MCCMVYIGKCSCCSSSKYILSQVILEIILKNQDFYSNTFSTNQIKLYDPGT